MREKFKMLFEAIRGNANNPAVLEDADYLTFLLSLIPVPGLSQSAQLANKIVSDHTLKVQFDAIKQSITSINSKINSIEDHLVRIDNIARTVDVATDVQEQIEKLLQDLRDCSSEFVVDTQNHSVQVLIKQIIDADIVDISAEGNSQNVLLNTKIKGKNTYLTAKNGSSNYIDGTEFTGDAGAVGMQRITQSGNIHVSGPSVGFGPNSVLGLGSNGVISFGPPVEYDDIQCPACVKSSRVRRNELIGRTQYQCPYCKKWFPFTIS